MIRKSIFDFVKLGTSLRYLQDAKPDYPIHSPHTTIENLESLFSQLHELGLYVTIRAADPLMNLTAQLKLLPKDSYLGANAAAIAEAAYGLRQTLMAEIKGHEAYVLGQKRIDIVRLMNGVSSLFAPRVFDRMPEIAQYDFAEAGKCISFDRPTAAAFHLLRGTECVLKELYCTLVKSQRCKFMWGPMVQHLKSRRKGKAHTVILDHLDNIRKSFRNPTQHPEKVYDIEEVQDLWGLCVDCINRMVPITSKK